MNPALILPLMMRTTRAGMSGISIPPAVSGGLQENQGTRTDLTSVRNLTEADTKKELAKIAAKAKEKQREHGGTAPGRTLCQISDEVIDTKKELAKIAAKAKENQRLSEGAGNKGMQISDNLSNRHP